MDPGNPDAQLQLGILLKDEKPVSAIEYLATYLKFQPERWDVHELLGNTFFKLGDYEKAVAEYNQCLNISHQQFQVRHKRAQASIHMKLWRDAKEDLDYLIQNDTVPKNQAAYYETLGAVYEGAGKIRQAEEARSKAQKIRASIL